MSTDDLTQEDPKAHGAVATVSAADPDRLVRLATVFGDQAAYLRRRAYWNIRSIVTTVILMTGLVIFLPPLVNVAEDLLLNSIGYQTSQIDFQNETARQAADVRARSQRLLEILSESKRKTDSIRSIWAGQMNFAPESIPGLDSGYEHKITWLMSNRISDIAIGWKLSKNEIFIAIRERDQWKLMETGVLLKNKKIDFFTSHRNGFFLAQGKNIFQITNSGTIEELPIKLSHPDHIYLIAASPNGSVFSVYQVTSTTSVRTTFNKNGQPIDETIFSPEFIIEEAIWNDSKTLLEYDGSSIIASIHQSINGKNLIRKTNILTPRSLVTS